jgi:hypothetical protein
MDNHKHMRNYKREFDRAAERIGAICQTAAPTTRQELLCNMVMARKHGTLHEQEEVRMCAIEWLHMYHELREDEDDFLD